MSLIKALAGYTQLRGLSHTEESLKAGLPFNEDPLDFPFFERAAARIGVSVKVEKVNPKDLLHFNMPCIAIKQDGECVLVLKATLETLIFVKLDNIQTHQSISLEEFEKDFKNEIIFLNYVPKSSVSFFSAFSWFFEILKQYKSLYLQAAAAGAIVNFFLVITTVYSLIVYDRVIPHEGYETLWVLTMGVVIIYFFDTVLRIIRAHFLDQASEKADIHMGSNLFEKIINVRMESRPPSAASMAFHMKEFESVREFLSSSTLITISDLPFVLLLLLVIGLIGGYLVFVPLIGIILILLLSIFAQPALANYVRSYNESSEHKYSFIINAIANIENIKSFNMHRKVQTQWEDCLSTSTTISNRLKSFNHFVTTITYLIQNLTYVFVIVAGVYLISYRSITFGGLIACSILSSRSLVPISQIVGLISRFNQTVLSVKQLNHIMNSPQERHTDTSYSTLTEFKGSVEFVNIDFAYPTQRLKSLKNFNLKIPEGNRIGILGRIGSGKTTLEKLILGLYQPSYGHVLIDGIEISQIDPFDLRKNIGYVPQDIILWRGTLKYNILGGNVEVSEEEFMKACEIAGVLDFVRFHPLGFNMPIAEDGSGLSQGQKQSVAIARALINNPKILLMDEPTASMDTQSERLFINRLSAHLTNQTLIIITHRVPILSLANRIVLVEQGQVYMDGERDKVLSFLNEATLKAMAVNKEENSGNSDKSKGLQ